MFLQAVKCLLTVERTSAIVTTNPLLCWWVVVWLKLILWTTEIWHCEQIHLHDPKLAKNTSKYAYFDKMYMFSDLFVVIFRAFFSTSIFVMQKQKENGQNVIKIGQNFTFIALWQLADGFTSRGHVSHCFCVNLIWGNCWSCFYVSWYITQSAIHCRLVFAEKSGFFCFGLFVCWAVHDAQSEDNAFRLKSENIPYTLMQANSPYICSHSCWLQIRMGC